MDKMNLYYRSPIPVQNLLTTAEGWRLRRLRYGREYRAFREELGQRDYSDREALLAFQDQQFVDFVRFAASKSPFYREFYADVNLSELRGVRDAHLLPALEKEVVRQNLNRIYTIDLRSGIPHATSGTTGKSLTVYYARVDLQRRLAYLDHFKAQHGYEHLKMRRASFIASKIIPPQQTVPIYWRDNHAGKQRIYSGPHCYGSNVAFYVEDLVRYKPHSIDGFPSAIYQVAKFMLSERIRLPKPPIAIFPTAETLLPHYQTRIEEAFDCPVLDQYASSEGAPFVTMCRLGKRHYCLDTGVIEDDGASGSLVTGFETHGTPLIRYRVGDSIRLAPVAEYCDCGSGLPLVREIEGRSHDYVFASNGNQIPAIYLSLDHVEFSSSILAMQYIQDRIGEVRVLLEVDGKYRSEMEDVIRGELSYKLGVETLVAIQVVDHIPRDPSGKFRFVINNAIGSVR